MRRVALGAVCAPPIIYTTTLWASPVSRILLRSGLVHVVFGGVACPASHTARTLKPIRQLF